MKLLLVLALGLAAVAAIPYNPERIIGGSITNIESYPYAVAMLGYAGSSFRQACGGTIINNRSVLSAAHCYNPRERATWRVRAGSTYAHSGGVVHYVQKILNHPSYNSTIVDNDVSIVRSASPFNFNSNVRAGSIAGVNYYLPDNSVVWAIGWGRTSPGGYSSEELRHVQVWTVNQNICVSRYATVRLTVTANMLCSGWLDVGGRDQCDGDSGSPLIHNNVVVGISSWGRSCALPEFPGVNARVSRFTSWILKNA